MRMINVLLVASALSLGLGAACQAADAPPAAMPAGVHIKEVTTPDGLVAVLADAKGMTLYTFDMDKEPGVSTCTGPCAELWPPLLASDEDVDTGPWTVTTRDGGLKMWAYHGKPLYTFVKDALPEDFRGNGLPQGKPVWHCALPVSED